MLKDIIYKIISNYFNHQDNVEFKNNFIKFQNLANNSNKRFNLNWEDKFPCMKDNTTNTSFDGHYLYHTAWAARVVKKINPTIHYDISSFLYFSTIISAFYKVKFFDFRPIDIKLSNLEVQRADLSNLQFETNSVKSISCMHVVEHIGLGRYGDPLDYDGDLKAISELKRVIIQGGNLLFVIPIGIPKIMFNAHRIYNYQQIISFFNEFELLEFSLIPDNVYDIGMIENASSEICDMQNYGCGCFWFKKNIKNGKNRFWLTK